jgi:hypothetical protein
MIEKPPLLREEVPRVTRFAVRDGYHIDLTFDDGFTQLIDFEPVLIGPLFGPLRDARTFNQVELDDAFGTLVWPNGADIAPEVLRDWPKHVDAIRQRLRQQFDDPAD